VSNLAVEPGGSTHPRGTGREPSVCSRSLRACRASRLPGVEPLWSSPQDRRRLFLAIPGRATSSRSCPDPTSGRGAGAGSRPSHFCCGGETIHGRLPACSGRDGLRRFASPLPGLNADDHQRQHHERHGEPDQPFRSCVSFDIDGLAIDSYSPTMAKTPSGTRDNRRRARSLSYRALYLGHETGGVVAPLGDVTALLRPHQAHKHEH
jgi:hypothetical protein